MHQTIRPTLGTSVVSAATNARHERAMHRFLALAMVGLAMVALAMVDGRAAPAGAQSRVTARLYPLPNYGGDSYPMFGFAIFNIDDPAWDDTISSVRVEPGTKIALYSDPHLTGTCEVLTASDPDLSNNRIGTDTVSSFHVGAECGAPVMRLFEHPNYGGASKVVDVIEVGSLVHDLREFGFNDTVTSIQVPAGQKLAVYEHLSRGGRCETFTASDPDLRDNWIGNDSISSAKVDGECFVMLFKDLNGTGELLTVTGDIPNLRSAGFNDSVSSIQVPNGTTIAVYQHADYTGTCETFRVGDVDLRNNRIGNDSISSVRVGRGC